MGGGGGGGFPTPVTGTPGVVARGAEPQYISAKTSVWWDIENCAVPKECDPHAIAKNISSALAKMNYSGPVSISAYGDTSGIRASVQHALSSTGVALNHVPAGVKDASDKKILVDMLFWAVDNPAPANFLLISGDRDFSNALHQLRMRRYNILLAQPQNASVPLVAAASTVWLWTTLVAGGPPLANGESPHPNPNPQPQPHPKDATKHKPSKGPKCTGNNKHQAQKFDGIHSKVESSGPGVKLKRGKSGDDKRRDGENKHQNQTHKTSDAKGGKFSIKPKPKVQKTSDNSKAKAGVTGSSGKLLGKKVLIKIKKKKIENAQLKFTHQASGTTQSLIKIKKKKIEKAQLKSTHQASGTTQSLPVGDQGHTEAKGQVMNKNLNQNQNQNQEVNCKSRRGNRRKKKAT
ncbi:PREDICTED: meiosis arrest female protein 1 [Nelumbo nucifera]|uniref:Meiosis arrest female protein 1 n=2 Tax=Nelumbo nucifera TaxID=4432 RepID=A0A1U8AWI7_NELNU|nr:PREDICTED: meiosis arrest female protein 1 [Nelumbo nucifera]DAD38433.1 TPA_asm: hypothetical protein HUJ06_009074 [Nelumbo nucifera]